MNMGQPIQPRQQVWSMGSESSLITTAMKIKKSNHSKPNLPLVDKFAANTKATTHQSNWKGVSTKMCTLIGILSFLALLVQPSHQIDLSDDICADRLCSGLPMGCLNQLYSSNQQPSRKGPLCNVLVSSKRFIDSSRPVSRDILFEIIALPMTSGDGSYAAVGFSDNGRMRGLVSECVQYREANSSVQTIKLEHSFNVPDSYENVKVKIHSGVKNLGNSFENGRYQCRWMVESGVEFSYIHPNGSTVVHREDLGYKNYHLLVATGNYDSQTGTKLHHRDRVSSMNPVSLAQTGHIKSSGSHILIRIHGSLMIAIWVGLVTLSIFLARFYKNEWPNSKIGDLAIWFVIHRAFMLTSWFGSVIAVIFAFMYTESYHPGVHQISGTTCLVLTTIQVLGGLLRPSPKSSKRPYFYWAHFIGGNVSYLAAMICLITAAFLAPAHLPPLYIWVIAAFVVFYAVANGILTIHQYLVHNSNSSTTYTSGGFVFRQFMMGVIVTFVVIFIIILIFLN